MSTKTLINVIAIATITMLPALVQAQGKGNGRAANPLNCPPGLAKKNPPCVPPGLARQGVTTQEYLNYDDEEWEQIIDENDDILTDVEIDDTLFDTLTDEEIADIFDLDPPSDGNRYAVIDGQVVELKPENQLILDQIRTLSTPVGTGINLPVEPTVSLSQDELIAIYDLPEPDDGRNYTVIDGQVVSVSDATYNLLQVIRIATAI